MINLNTPHLISLLRDLLDQDITVRIQVTGQSMQPFLLGGETVTLNRVPTKTLRIGDLILFADSANRPILHRIVRRRSKNSTILLQTKGDGLGWMDSSLCLDQVLGRVEQISFPRTGTDSGHPVKINLNHPGERIRATVRAYQSLYSYYINRLQQRLRSFL